MMNGVKIRINNYAIIYNKATILNSGFIYSLMKSELTYIYKFNLI